MTTVFDLNFEDMQTASIRDVAVLAQSRRRVYTDPPGAGGWFIEAGYKSFSAPGKVDLR
jgi:hypothetical protein